MHIRLICWGSKHVQAISAEALRAMIVPPICTHGAAAGEMCCQPIWAVEHDDEPTRYVGRPPHTNWERWADCVPSR